MDSENPYEAPQLLELSRSIEVPHWEVTFARRRCAIVFFVGSFGFALVYTYLDEVVLKTSVGAWPMLFSCFAISVIASVLTRDLLLAPLSCFLPVLAGDILAGLVRDWAYAQMHLCIPLAAGVSLPALIIVLYLRWNARRKLAIDN